MTKLANQRKIMIETHTEFSFSPQGQAETLMRGYGHLEAVPLLKPLIRDVFPGKIAVSSSFGAESAVILHMVAQIDPGTPILFIDTRKLFPETLEYRDQLVEHLGLTNVQITGPSDLSIIRFDPHDDLFHKDHDACCHFRKVAPFEVALEDYSAIITGRKRYQSNTRSQIDVIEADENRIKINPVAKWNADDIQRYMNEHELPAHPLVRQGYLSIGCAPCTSPVKEGEDARAGRWRDTEKTECGIHIVNGRIVRKN